MSKLDPFNLKPCPNCGGNECFAEGIRPEDLAYCDCGEERTLEEWQCDSARERILRAALEEAQAELAAIKQSAMGINKYSQSFYDGDIRVSRLVCLGLLESISPEGITQIEELIEHLSAEESSALFGVENWNFDEDDLEDFITYLIDTRRGWLVSASLGEPFDIRLDEKGDVLGYGISCGRYRLLAYKETLEDALEDIDKQASQIRLSVFNKARQAQGFPVRECDEQA